MIFILEFGYRFNHLVYGRSGVESFRLSFLLYFAALGRCFGYK